MEGGSAPYNIPLGYVKPLVLKGSINHKQHSKIKVLYVVSNTLLVDILAGKNFRDFSSFEGHSGKLISQKYN